MRVMQVQGNSGYGGSEIHTYLLAKGLRDRGIGVVVVIQPGGPVSDELRAAGIQTVEIDMFNKWNPRTCIRLRRIIEREKIDIVHSHLRNADFHSFLATRLNPSIIFVSTIHDILFLGKDGKVTMTGATRIYRYILESFPARIITISDSIRDDCLEKITVTEPHRLIRIYNSIDAEESQTASPGQLQYWKDKIGWKETSPIIGLVGRMTPQKGHVTFLEAFKQVLKVYPLCRAVMVGSGPLEAEIKQRINVDNVLRDHVLLLGAQRQFKPLYKLFTIAVVPSYWEAFGRVAAEAMINGVPVVASNTGGLAEIISDNHDGLLFAPGNAGDCAKKILSLLADSEKRILFGERSLEKVRRLFDLPRFIDEHVKLYEQLVRERSSG